MRFEFSTATRIIFGPGTILEAAALCGQMGKRACVVIGRTRSRAEPFLERLSKQSIDYVTFNVTDEPTTMLARVGIETAREAASDFVVSIGGGSVLDTGKVIAAMLTNAGKLEDYLEVVGAGKPLLHASVPHIAIPTTAGTGAEVTRNAVLGVPEHRVKVSMRSLLMLPRLAVVDPELTHSLPPALTATTGLDTLTQLVETYVSDKANPLTDGICREGLRRVGCSLRRAFENGDDADARQDMAMASLFSGMGLANAKLGAVHGFASPLGGMLGAPHGALCARLLPFVMETNVQALRRRAARSPALARYDEVAKLLTGKPTAGAADGVRWVQELCSDLKIPSLAQFGLREHDFSTIVAKTRKSNSVKGNPVALTDDELVEIVRRASRQMA